VEALDLTVLGRKLSSRSRVRFLVHPGRLPFSKAEALDLSILFSKHVQQLFARPLPSEEGGTSTFLGTFT